jgi:hypothetical protein
MAPPFEFEGQPAALARQKALSFNSLEAMRIFAPSPKDMTDENHIGFGAK